jgi:hypothetical protein
MQLSSSLHEPVAVVNLGHDLELIFEQLVEGFGDESVIIGDDNARAAGTVHGNLLDIQLLLFS